MNYNELPYDYNWLRTTGRLKSNNSLFSSHYLKYKLLHTDRGQLMTTIRNYLLLWAQHASAARLCSIICSYVQLSKWGEDMKASELKLTPAFFQQSPRSYLIIRSSSCMVSSLSFPLNMHSRGSQRYWPRKALAIWMQDISVSSIFDIWKSPQIHKIAILFILSLS